MLYWRGHLRAQEVQAFLGVSERTARSLTRGWRIEGMLPRYRAADARRLVPVPGFEPSAAVCDPNVALSLLLVADQLPGNPFSTVAPSGGGHDLALSAPIASRAIRNMVAACLDRAPVWLLYAAKSGRQEFVFHPSALIRARGRYHLRGYRSDGHDRADTSLDDRFVDVVPARAVEAQPAEDVAFVGLEDDAEWQTFETRCFDAVPGKQRTRKRPQQRELETIFGTVEVQRTGYGAEGAASLHPLDTRYDESTSSHGWSNSETGP